MTRVMILLYLAGCSLMTVVGCGDDDGPDADLPIDAALADAGVAPDAPSTDASTPDANELDASTPDASAPDAMPDASTPDATPPDAAPDAAPPDAAPDAMSDCTVPGTHATIQAALDAGCATITIEAGTYDENLTIASPVTLIGVDSVTIDGGGTARVITATAAATLRNLTITHGSALQGGGIFTNSTLVLENSRVTENLATGYDAKGGGIFTYADLTLDASAVDHNQATAPADNFRAEGGGIYESGGTLTLTNGSTVEDNTVGGTIDAGAWGAGGGISIHGGPDCVIAGASGVRRNRVAFEDGTSGGSAWGGGIYANNAHLTVSGDSAIEDNLVTVQAALGGDFGGAGLFLTDSTLIVDHGAISNNAASAALTATADGWARGGGIFVEGLSSVSLVDSQATGNLAESLTSGSGNARADGGFVSGGTYSVLRLTLSRSTVSGNGANATGSASGGGVSLYAAPTSGIVDIRVIDSTMSGNSATSATLTARGGAFNLNGANGSTIVARLASATVTGNQVTAAGSATGGGLASTFEIPDTVMFDLRNTLVYGNTAATAGADCWTDTGTRLNSNGYNLFGTTESCTIVGDTTGNQIGVDPLLGALADNGGPTETHALGAGSPAIDTGNPAGCTDTGITALTVDQRGENRAANGRCDIGAYEYQP